MTGDLDKIAPMSRDRLCQELLIASFRHGIVYDVGMLPEDQFRMAAKRIVWQADELMRQLAGNPRSPKE